MCKWVTLENATQNMKIKPRTLMKTICTGQCWQWPEVSEEPQEINAVWINVNKCIEVKLSSYDSTVHIVSSSMHLLSFGLALEHVLPISPAFDNPKCSQLSVQVIAECDIDSESEILVF